MIFQSLVRNLIWEKNLKFPPFGAPLSAGSPAVEVTGTGTTTTGRSPKVTPPQGEVSTEGDYPAGVVSHIKRPLTVDVQYIMKENKNRKGKCQNGIFILI